VENVQVAETYSALWELFGCLYLGPVSPYPYNDAHVVGRFESMGRQKAGMRMFFF
jgi:hypothetical protein